jgi:Mu-like prophage I protein
LAGAPIEATGGLKDDKRAIIASVAVDLPIVADEASLPQDIQWMPPGAHTINASRGGMPVSLGVNVNSEGAANVQHTFEEIMKLVAKNEEDRPYVDLNHNDEEAAAWPSGFFWAGDDPTKGGIRMRISEWSAAGKQAVLGKNFRRFSPTFYVDENGIVIGAPVNMGGLVNRAAFRKMQPVWSKSSAEDRDPSQEEQQKPTQPPSIMKSLMAVLAKLGIITSAEVDEPTAVTQVTAKIGELTSSASTAQTELTQTKAKLTDTETKLDAALTLGATATVEAKILEGCIPGQDPEVKAKWIALIKADPLNASLIPQPNPALTKLIQAKGKGDAENNAGKGAGADHPFLVKAKDYAHEHKVSLDFATTEVARTDAKLYQEYADSLGK